VLSWHSSNELGEVSQWPCHNDSTINIVVGIIRPHRSTTYVDAAYCYQPSSFVCRSVTLVSLAKTAELIEMPFGLRTWLSPETMYQMGIIRYYYYYYRSAVGSVV